MSTDQIGLFVFALFFLPWLDVHKTNGNTGSSTLQELWVVTGQLGASQAYLVCEFAYTRG